MHVLYLLRFYIRCFLTFKVWYIDPVQVHRYYNNIYFCSYFSSGNTSVFYCKVHGFRKPVFNFLFIYTSRCASELFRALGRYPPRGRGFLLIITIFFIHPTDRIHTSRPYFFKLRLFSRSRVYISFFFLNSFYCQVIRSTA